MSEYELGTVAMVRDFDGTEFRAVRDARNGAPFWQTFGEGEGRYYDNEVTAIRRLVELDPEDREAVASLMGHFSHADGRIFGMEGVVAMQAALREIIAPPKRVLSEGVPADA